MEWLLLADSKRSDVSLTADRVGWSLLTDAESPDAVEVGQQLRHLQHGVWSARWAGGRGPVVTQQGTAADSGSGVQEHLQGLRPQAAQGGNAGGKKAVLLFLFPRPRCYSIIRTVFFRSRQTSVLTRGKVESNTTGSCLEHPVAHFYV